MTSLRDDLRIGGDFELHASDFARAAFPQAAVFAWRHTLWTDTGRSALLIAAKSVLAQGGKPRAWLPAYSCPSVAQPFRQLGFEIAYYPSSGAITGDVAATLPQPAPGELFLFIHYFGHRNETMIAAARQFKAAGVWVIEDSVQASLAPQFGDYGHFGITSLRKFIPMSDGAALLAHGPMDLQSLGVELRPADETLISQKLVAKILRGANAPDASFLGLHEAAESRLDEFIVPRQMSWFSSWLLERTDVPAAIAKRRANWTELHERLDLPFWRDRLQPVFPTLTEEVVPLGYPVRVAGERRDELRRFLATQQIYCPVHWPLEHLPQDPEYLRERELGQALLTLPLDQRMTTAHVERLTSKIDAYFEKVLPSQ